MGRPEIRTEIEIEAPVATVWGVLTDWPAYADWNPWMQRIVGTLEMGARLDVSVRVGEREIGFQPKVVRLEDGHSFRWLGHMFVRGLFDGEHAFELESLEPRRTRLVHSERFGGLLTGLVLALIGKQTEEGFRAMNQALKERCETPKASDRSSV